MIRPRTRTVSLALAVLSVAGIAATAHAHPILPGAAVYSLIAAGLQDADTLYNEGYDAQTKGNYEAAVAAYTKAVKARPNFADAYFNRALAYYALKQYDKAIADYTEVIKLKPKIVDTYVNRAYAYREKGEFEAAVRDLETAAALPAVKPAQMVDILNARALANFGRKNYDAAIADYTKILASKPDDPIAYVNRGLAYANKGDYASAVADYTKYIAAKPTDAFGYINRAEAHLLGTKNYDAAVADYTKYLSMKADDPDALLGRAAAYANKGDSANAIEDYTAYLAKKPTDVNALTFRARAFVATKQWDKAAADYTKILSTQPGNATALGGRASVAMQKQDWNGAVTDYTAYLAKNPTGQAGIDAYYNRAVAYTNLKNYESAAADFDRVIAAAPEDVTAYSARAVAYANMAAKNPALYDRAIADYTKVIALKPTSDAATTAYLNRALAYNATKRPKEALADLASYLTRKPDDARALALQAEIASVGADPTVAVDINTKAIQRNPKDTNALFNRGVAYYNLKQYDKAAADYGQVIALKPDDAEAYSA
ncbi:MAG TPA: tetratricopeptide repeat protein, partial [Armatimonadaceae bacterium]|nr:tetratricopeptide repeat protein [Armatimonadaceae bacterium]